MLLHKAQMLLLPGKGGRLLSCMCSLCRNVCCPVVRCQRSIKKGLKPLLLLSAGGCCRSTHWLLIDATQRRHGTLHSHRSQPYTTAIGACHVYWQPGHGVVLSRRDALSNRELGARSWEPSLFKMWQAIIIIVPVRVGFRVCSEERRWLYTYRRSTAGMPSACNLSVVIACCSFRDEVLD